MEAESNYWFIWLIYLAASAIFYPIYWRLTRFGRQRWLSYSARALMAALILTPWYANIQGATMAPALMVMTLDAITIGTEAAVRAMVPLLAAMLLAEVVATVFWVSRRKRKRAGKTEA